MRRDRLLPTCAARRLPTTTAACTAVPLRESKRATSSPFVTVTYLAIGAAPFSYVGLARCAERVAPNRRVGTRRHHCKRRQLYKANETWMKRVETRASGGAGRGAGALTDPRHKTTYLSFLGPGNYKSVLLHGSTHLAVPCTHTAAVPRAPPTKYATSDVHCGGVRYGREGMHGACGTRRTDRNGLHDIGGVSDIITLPGCLVCVSEAGPRGTAAVWVQGTARCVEPWSKTDL